MLISLTKDKSLFKHWEYGNIYLSMDCTRLSIGGFVFVKTSSDKNLLKAHSVLIVFSIPMFARGSVRMFLFDLNYQISQYRWSQLWSAFCYRSFSSESKSDVRVVEKVQIKSSDAACEQKLLFGQILCEARQTYIKKEANSFFKLFENKICKASKIVQETFTYENIFNLFLMLEFALSNHSQTGYFKYNLQRFFGDPCFLMYCYFKFKCKKLSEVSNVSIQKVTLSAIMLLSTKFIFKMYKPKPIRRVFIKGFTNKMRPLAIVATLDAIVQKALLIFLEPLFEKQFLRCSYGFRENKNCHMCLSSIYYTWTGVKWFIEADFLHGFSTITHLNLMCLINQRFYNYDVSRIIALLLKAGYMRFGHTVNSELEDNCRIFQGSLLSSFFCHILLHELDVFAITLCNNFSHSKKITFSKGCIKLVRYLNVFWENTWYLVNSRVNKTSSLFFFSSVALDAVKKKIYEKDYTWRKLTYIRYDDDFLLSFIGKKKEAVSVLVLISHFVELLLGVRLNSKKTRVRHHEKGVYFLGYKIWKKYGSTFKKSLNFLNDIKCDKFARLNFSVPLEKLFLFYLRKGFIMKAKKKSAHKFVGRRQDRWLFLKSDAAVVYRFNEVLRRVSNYYSGSTQQSILSRLYYVLKKSAALTIAHRNSKKYASWTLKKYGKDISIKTQYKNGSSAIVRLFAPKVGKVRWHIENGGQLTDLLTIPAGVVATEISNPICSVRNCFCSIPNCLNTAIEWYTIKHRKIIKSHKAQKKSNAYIVKWIPICLKHYLSIYSGKYDGPSLRKLRGYILNTFS